MKKIPFNISMISFLFVAFSCFSLYACKESVKEDELSKSLAQIDEQAGEYKPQTTDVNPQSSHIAVKVSYDNGKWVVDSSYSELRPGRLPYLTKGSGSFEVIYSDASGKELGRYKYEDPTLRRVCEGEKPGFSKVDKAILEILLPGNIAIDRFEVKQDGKTITSFRVPAVRKVNSTDTPNKTDTAQSTKKS